jgi:hypothetical protein
MSAASPFGSFLSLLDESVLLHQLRGERENLQDTNGIERIKGGHISSVGNQIVDFSICDSGSFFGGFLGWCERTPLSSIRQRYLEIFVTCDIRLKDVDVLAVTQLF